MLFYLLLAFILVPLVELYLLLYVAHTYLGLGLTLALVITTGTAGAMLARQQGTLVWRRIQTTMAAGRMPTDELLHGLCTLAGGLLLLTPGILTDVLGFSLLLPPTRILFVTLLKKRLKNSIQVVHFGGGFSGGPPAGESAPIRDAEDVQIRDAEDP
jgi:UPF0716 protein FxsA